MIEQHYFEKYMNFMYLGEMGENEDKKMIYFELFIF